MRKWYTRTVLAVADVERARAFYVGQLGFAEAWRHEQDGALLVVEVQRQGCELILAAQWPGRAGQGLVFLSLDQDDLDRARAEFEAKGVAVTEGWWGYRLAIVTDPDGNQLLFPYPAEGG